MDRLSESEIIILSIDAALHNTGVACLQIALCDGVLQYNLLWHNLVYVPSTHTEAKAVMSMSTRGCDAILELLNMLSDHERFIDIMIVEKPRAGKHRHSSLPAKLSAAAGLWFGVMAGIYRDIKSCWIDAYTWQREMLGVKNASAPSIELKQMAIDYVKRVLKVEVDDNVADAVLMGIYAGGYYLRTGKLPMAFVSKKRKGGKKK
jgi:hypothetical protein